MSTLGAEGVYGTVCTEDQYQNSTNLHPNTKYPTITCLTRGQSIGLTVTAEASFLSVIAVTVIFVLIGVCSNTVLSLAVLVHLDEANSEKCATL